MPMKKLASTKPDELRAEYDLSKLGQPVRGKYLASASASTNVVLLDPDVARVFPTAEAVNTALRMLVDVASVATPKKASTGRKK